MLGRAELFLLLLISHSKQVVAGGGLFRSSRGQDALGAAMLGYVISQQPSSSPGNSSQPTDTILNNPFMLPLLLSSLGGGGTVGLAYALGALGNADEDNLQTLAMLGLASGSTRALAPLTLLRVIHGPSKRMNNADNATSNNKTNWRKENLKYMLNGR